MTLRARILALVIALFLALTYLFAWSPLLSVKKINTSGLPVGVSSQGMIAKSGISLGEKMARIEPRSVEKALGEISWVSEIAITRQWLKGEVSIAIKARTPVGLYKGRALDESGVLFDLPAGKRSDLPTVSAATPELGLSAISLFTELPADLRKSLISMSASNLSTIYSWHRETGRNVKISWGTAEEIALKVSVYRALLELPENATIRRVDLSAPHAPIVS